VLTFLLRIYVLQSMTFTIAHMHSRARARAHYVKRHNFLTTHMYK